MTWIAIWVLASIPLGIAVGRFIAFNDTDPKTNWKGPFR